MDFDDIASISTIDDGHDPDADYFVKQILAEGQVDGQKKYLTEWDGFPLGKASWEPTEHFNQPDLLQDWINQQQKHKSGTAIQFNIDEWRIARIRELRDKYARHEMRNKKRLSRGQEVTEYDFSLSEMIAHTNKMPEDKPGSIGLADIPIETTSGSPILENSTLETDFSESMDICSNSATENSPSVNDYTEGMDISLDHATESVPSVNDSAGGTIILSDGASKSYSGQVQTTDTTDSMNEATEHGDQSIEKKCPSVAENVIDPCSSASPTPSIRETGDNQNGQVQDPIQLPLLPKEPSTDGTRHETDKMDIDDSTCVQSSIVPSNDNIQSLLKAQEACKLDSSRQANATQPRAPAAGMKTSTSQPAVHDFRDKNSNIACPASLNTNDRLGEKKKVLFSTAPPETFTLDNVEESLFVDEESPSQPADCEAISKADNSHSKDSTFFQDQTPKESKPKTCVIRLKEYICSFHISSPIEKSETEWYRILMENETFHFLHICTAHDFINSLRMRNIRPDYGVRGTVYSYPGSNDMQTITDYLRSSSTGFLCHDGQSCVLLYSTECADWEQAPLPNAKPPAGHTLRYMAFTPNEWFRLSDLSLEFNQKPSPSIGFFDKNLYHSLLPINRAPQNCDSFFLIFPPSAKPEENLIYRWLKLFNKDCEIRSSAVAGHWHIFLEGTGGTVILHQDCINSIYRIKGLEKLLHRKSVDSKFWTFSLPVCAPLHQTLTIGEDLNQPGITFNSTFPPGVAVMVTPSFWISQPLQAYNLLKWVWMNFSEEASKYRHGRLVVCNGILDWLLNLTFEERKTSDGSVNTQDIAVAREKSCKLMIQLLRETLVYGQCSVVCAPVHIDGNDEQSLVNWFGWWSISQMNQFRKFSVIGSDNDDRTRLSRQIERRALRDLFKKSGNPVTNLKTSATNLKISATNASFKLVRTDSTEDLGYFLKKLNDEAKRTLDSQNPLHIYPSLLQWRKSEVQCSDLAKWARFSADRMQQDGQHRNRKCTQAGFFYTVNEAKSGTGPLEESVRDPWIAFLRPIQLPDNSSETCELLIWDYSLRDLARQLKRVPDSKLLSSHRELITEVTSLGDEIGLPLSHIWIGGFKSSYFYKYPLDNTLDWLKATIDRMRNWLPLHHDDVLRQGWSLVLRASSCDSHSIRGVPPSSAIDTNEISPKEELRVVFEPPKGGFDRPKPCVNRLYQWAIAPCAESAEENTYVYVPTLEWYKEQRDAGRGFEHIRLCSWKPFFEHEGIHDPESFKGKKKT